MNIFKTSSPVRLIAFGLVGVILVCTFGFTVDGWTMGNDGMNSGSLSAGTSTPGDKESSEELPEDEKAEIYIPAFTSCLTGLEVSEELSKKQPIAISIDSKNSSYGLSSAEIIAEIPIENGDTRLLAFIEDVDGISKLGALAPTRGYISNVAHFLGSSILSYGIDGGMENESASSALPYLDMSKNPNCYYSEFEHYQYTNSSLLTEGLASSQIPDERGEQALPYLFNNFGNEQVKYDTTAAYISIAFSMSNTTELQYSEQSNSYVLSKGGNIKKDLTNGKTLEYANCLVLFADSVTYETTSGEEMVMNTATCGTGYYFTAGTLCSITWCADDNGNMTISDSSGDILTVNRGRTYIAFVKSSRIQSVTFE